MRNRRRAGRSVASQSRSTSRCRPPGAGCFDEVLPGLAPGDHEAKESHLRPKQVTVSISYDGSRDVTVHLAKPTKGPLRLLVSPGIVAADGAGGVQGYTTTFK